MPRLRLSTAMILGTLACGCGGDGDAVLDMFGSSFVDLEPGGAALDGEFGGEELDASVAISSDYDLGGGEAETFVLLSNVDPCPAFSDGYIPYGLQLVLIELADVDASGTVSAPNGPDQYPVVDVTEPYPDGDLGFVTYYRVDPNECAFDTAVRTVGGTITIEDTGLNVYTGTAEMETEFGEDVSLSFDSTSCPALDDFIDNVLPCG